MSVLVLATTNPGKVKEFRALISLFWDAPNLTLATPDELGLTLPPVDETGTTFAGNATLKALTVAQSTGHPALADDSGLCVDALNGAPGIHSARWTGPTDADRTVQLLHLLAAVDTDKRTARFICAAAIALPDGTLYCEEGSLEGVIADTARGANGFGYDPIFQVSGTHRTLAELTNDEKNALSHRAQAINRLGAHLSRTNL